MECRRQGVRMYADAVVNHMVGGGNDANPLHRNPQAGCAKWGAKESSGDPRWSSVSDSISNEGARSQMGPSPFYTQKFAYATSGRTQQPPSQEFPAAAYGPTDFHCERALNSWTDPLILNAGWSACKIHISDVLRPICFFVHATLSGLERKVVVDNTE
jgi:alpha-amylase